MASSNNASVQQLKPQPIANRAGSGANILVSSRQKGNPVLSHIKNINWEYVTDIPADFILGTTTCALFLSLKYHKLHPEYIYGRIRALAGKYKLRVLLTLVDIEAHEESLKELSKTSLVNNVTIILAWSAQEAGKYLELFKSYENASPTSIKGHQSTAFIDRMVEFTTAPRSVNKTDAISLVSNFGTVRTAVNAQPEDISLIAGWGDVKVKRWCSAVREPFRSQHATRKVLSVESVPVPSTRTIRERELEERPNRSEVEESVPESEKTTRKRVAEPEMSDGVLAALSKLRQQ